jgi:predicted O-linked N-acetylglucosamine transferase (SPINDLY family)
MLGSLFRSPRSALLREYRATLDRDRMRLPLFDSERFTREFEAVLWSAARPA